MDLKSFLKHLEELVNKVKEQQRVDQKGDNNEQ